LSLGGLNAVSKCRDFPLIIETYREIFQDYFDLEGKASLSAPKWSIAPDPVSCKFPLANPSNQFPE
jgi:hypothetical protein